MDPALLGRPTQALVSVRLQVHNRHLIDDFYSHVLLLPESISVYHVTGSDDYVVHVAVADTEHLRSLVLDLTATGRGRARGDATHLPGAAQAGDRAAMSLAAWW